jgi:regulator of RNase E activity RraA
MSNAVFDVLRKVTTATITTMLLKKGIRRCWMNGPKPLVPKGERIIGPAFTLRFVPVREDLATPESWAHPISTRAAIEDMPEGAIAVADAMGVSSAGIFGDILCARMKKRNVAALVTDGVLRDRAGVVMSGLPVWCAGVAAPASVNGLLCRLAAANRLRRLRDFSWRHYCSRRRRGRGYSTELPGLRRP